MRIRSGKCSQHLVIIRFYSIFSSPIAAKDIKNNDKPHKDTSIYLTYISYYGKIIFVQGYVINIGGILWQP